MPLSPDEAADRFGRLTTTKDGKPVVMLLGDPDLSDGFLSVVQRGANARRFQVAKADLEGDELHPANVGALATAEDKSKAKAWLESMFGGFLNMIGIASKGSGPTSFDAAVGVPVLYDALWIAHDGLVTVVGNILRDEEVLDKRAKILDALEAHRDFLAAHLDALPTLKADQVREVAELARKADLDVTLERANLAARKVARVIETADRGRLNRAKAILEDVVARLDPGPGPSLFPDLTLQEDDMNVQIAASQAADLAVKAAKAAGVTDPAKLAEIGAAASTEVFKAAVMGPPQPALQSDNLARQRAMAGDENGSGWNAEGALLSAINSGAGSLVMKSTVAKDATGRDVVRSVVVKDLDGKERLLQNDGDALAWLVGRAAKAQELEVLLRGDGSEENPGYIAATEGVLVNVAKALGIPEATAQGSGTPAAVPTPDVEDDARARARKADDDAFAGSALDFGAASTADDGQPSA